MELTMDLDLGFRPVSASAAQSLSQEQIAQYNRFGYVQPFDVFSTEEIAALRSYFDRLMADLGEEGAYGINCYQARMAGIWDIATEPRILDLVQ
nr:phytanoyl-CoA dioxygenase [Dinoroseobacter sp.]